MIGSFSKSWENLLNMLFLRFRADYYKMKSEEKKEQKQQKDDKKAK